ncbi:MAG: hypothetical protein B7O98_06395 [Zestosphaera tikiterensis]|uniref:VWFA domain-containing protein n=1 Tax=Zestosphaera tikiterensis TaxID=1973259 RepID=A0A2R7Y4J7_9CREN|nr:MAG: hypothetical protein B7O98_06395 [Zestosphaera tikiterensis]
MSVKGVLKGVNYGDPVVLFRGEKVVKLAKRFGLEGDFLTLGLGVDLFYTLYLPHPVVVGLAGVDEGLSTHYSIVKALVDLEELVEVKKHTILDSSLSTLASVSLIQHLIEELEGLNESVDFKDLEGRSGKGKLTSALKEALKRVGEEAENMRKLKELMAVGTAPGKGSHFDLDESGEDVIKLARNADVSKLLEVLQIVPELFRRSRRRFERFSRGELAGYDLGSDLERVVPEELVLPRKYFLMKFSESKLLLYEKRLPKALGSIYLLVDKSGSMEGDKISWAKATAIALLIKARRERREFNMRFFDGLPHDRVKVSKNVKPTELLNLIKYLARVRSGGGTDITRAIATACDDITLGVTKNTSDIIVVTDGEDTLSVNLLKRKLRQANAKLTSVMILGDNKDLKTLSEHYLTVKVLDENAILKIVETPD